MLHCWDPFSTNKSKTLNSHFGEGLFLLLLIPIWWCAWNLVHTHITHMKFHTAMCVGNIFPTWMLLCFFSLTYTSCPLTYVIASCPLTCVINTPYINITLCFSSMCASHPATYVGNTPYLCCTMFSHQCALLSLGTISPTNMWICGSKGIKFERHRL
jgi:hypothetical protein